MNNTIHRRLKTHNYHGRGIYMITIATEGRRPVLGVLSVNSISSQVDEKDDMRSLDVKHIVNVSNNNDSQYKNVIPFVSLTTIGKIVTYHWKDISVRYPQIKSLVFQVMPDHIHGILFVEEELSVHIGQVIGAFKFATTKSVMSQTLTGRVGTIIDRQRIADGCYRLWEKSYNDLVLYGKKQLDHMISYVKDNPRRLYIKKAVSPYFQRSNGCINGRVVTMIGNKRLLESESRLFVKCSRKMNDAEVQQAIRRFIDLGHLGAVLVSPFISPGERDVEKRALQEGIGVIKIMPKGFSEYYKPGGVLFDACAEGRLLLVSQYDYSSRKRILTRVLCEEMNGLARIIASE